MQTEIDRLLALMVRLRDPQTGCPWDAEQTFVSIAPYSIEEAYEVADAIAREDLASLKDELGDLLLQVVFHARMAEEAGHFAFGDVAQAISDKLIRRHPHVFGDASRDAEDMRRNWEQSKAEERAARAATEGVAPSALDGVPLALPALTRCEKLQSRAARVGFDWPEAIQVLDKIEEEIKELRAEMTAQPVKARLEDELGDLLFAVVNLARHVKIDPEAALRAGNAKFERRFRAVEQELAEHGLEPASSSLERMEQSWAEVKRRERMQKPKGS
ncbi:MAG: nucleoside triphosphate pyrophosphohydrolase [Alphaproteobacteria bacterium]|nr:nucleoside triphosphate pyrophosphohydrolase [Alphaproteobacteria bacterium]